MSDDNSFSLINFGKVAKPANTLIEKVSNAVGGVFSPWQIKRVAKAEAEANLIKAKNEIEISDLHRRAMQRFVDEEAKKQENMENITKKAIASLDEHADPAKMENDWITNFFDKSRIVSDEEMQTLWANVLAGEANASGTFSRRTVNLLADLDKSDAELFQNLCRFGWDFGSFTPLIFNTEAKIYNNYGINFSSLSHLDSLGLIQFDPIGGYERKNLPQNFSITYCMTPLLIKLKVDQKNLPFGKVLLSRAGRELAQVVQVPSVDGFYGYVKEHWKEYTISETVA